jgi:hypothetical protein
LGCKGYWHPLNVTVSLILFGVRMIQISKVWFFLLLKIGAIALISLVVLLSIGTLLNLVSYRSKLVPPIRVVPSAESVGREYLQAVIQKKHHYISENRQCVHNQLLRDIAQYGDAEVQNIIVGVKWNSGNSDSLIEVTSIKFDYRSVANSSWQRGEIRLLTTTNLEPNESLQDALPFRRIHCAGAGV